MSHRSRWLVPLAAALLLWSSVAEARNFLDSVGTADKAILADLHDGRIIEAHPFGAQQNTGSLWKVKVEHQGRVRTAVFKPREFGDRDGWARTPMEVAMYKINRILGMDSVPPTAYRRNLTLGGNHFAEGALMVWVDDAHPIQNVDKKVWKPKHEPFASDLRILQMLGRDADHENPKNIIRGQHWKDGKYRVMKVDNEASMRKGAKLELEYNSAIWGKVNRFNPETYARLKELNFNDLKGDIGEFVSDGEIRDMLKVRDKLVAHIDKQVRTRGKTAVFFSKEEVGFNASRQSGRKAEKKDISKFEKMMAKKGARVEYVSARDKSLRGGVARTVLGKDGSVTVKVARGKGVKLRMGTLVEELIHVNQLNTMAKRVGGHKALRRKLQGNSAEAKALRASMEAYAKGRVSLTARNKREKKSVVKEKRKEQARVAKNAGVRSGTTNLWRNALQADGKKGKTARAKTTAKVKTTTKARPRTKVRARTPVRQPVRQPVRAR